MAEEGDSGEKTEEPTGRKKSEARKEGMVGKSHDFSSTLATISGFIALQHVVPDMQEDMKQLMIASYTTRYTEEAFTIPALQENFLALLWIMLPNLLIIVLAAAFFGAGCTAIQTNFLWSSKLLAPKFSLLNPISGVKRIFSLNNFVQTTKALVKLCIMCPIAYFAFIGSVPQFISLIDAPIDHLLPFTGLVSAEVFWDIMKYFFIISILDLIWQKYQTKKKLKMSKQEIKDEQKALEGDETTKRKIRRIAMQRVRNRMFQEIPKADVVVTNPTHIAVALKYSIEAGSAPMVVAKGQGFVAERIKALASEHGVPVLERKPLARALYKSVEIGQEIPYELYNAVAEILAYVYKLKGKTINRKTSRQTA